jgi:hypothetical protein
MEDNEASGALDLCHSRGTMQAHRPCLLATPSKHNTGRPRIESEVHAGGAQATEFHRRFLSRIGSDMLSPTFNKTGIENTIDENYLCSSVEILLF